MKTTRIVSLCLLLASPAVHADDLEQAIADCDSDKNKELNQPELIACFEKHDVLAQKAAKAKTPTQIATDTAQDLLFKRSSVSYREASDHLRARALREKKPENEPFISDRLFIGRKLTDAVDPRKAESNVPFVFSYTDDRGEGDDAFVAAGSIAFEAWSGELGSGLESSFVPTLSFDITTKTAPSESTITASLPFRFLWVESSQSKTTWINEWEWAIEPKYITDRDGRRDAFEAAWTNTFASERLLRAGYNIWVGGSAELQTQHILFWEPSIAVEAGNITDAGGNEKLEAIKAAGEYLRAAPGVAFKWNLPQLGQRVSFGLGYTHRFDLKQDWDRGFGSASIQYDLSKIVALTLSYRKGRKPPDFAETDEVLFGIGIQQQR
jgi:hypothetical protein